MPVVPGGMNERFSAYISTAACLRDESVKPTPLLRCAYETLVA